MSNDRLGGRTQNQRLSQFFAAADGHYRELRRESLDVMLFFFDETLRDEQRKRHVLVTGGLKPPIQRLLNVFP